MKLLTYIDADTQPHMGGGNLCFMIHATYLKGKELGCDDITMEWPTGVSYKDSKFHFIKCPKYSILPVKFIEKSDVVMDDYDYAIDFNSPNSFFDGYNPIYDNRLPKNGNNWRGIMSYPNVYRQRTGEDVFIDIPKDKLDKPYILFHIRNINAYGGYRNPNPKLYNDILNTLKNEFGNKYEYWKTGDSSRVIDRMFDFVAPYYAESDYNDFFRLINNASLQIGCNSGPTQFAETFNIPIVVIEGNYIDDKGRLGERTEENWQRRGGIGKTYYDWVNPDRELLYYKETGIDKEEIIRFARKWL